MRSLAAVGLLVVVAAAALGAEPPVPAPQGYVTDLAGVVPPAARARMTARIEALKARTGAEIAVVTVRTTAPYDDFTYAMRVFDAWKPGRRGEDTGAVVLLALDDRKLRVVTGYGLEGILPDGLVGEIQDRQMIPSLRAGRPDEALERGVEAIARRIETGGVGSPTPSDEGVPLPPWVVLLVLLLFVLLVLYASRQQRRMGNDGGMVPRRRSPWIVGPGGFGGGFPGGWSGGGGGFGGFGGGMSGGGGAGRSW